jgi:signal peptidase I
MEPTLHCAGSKGCRSFHSDHLVVSRWGPIGRYSVVVFRLSKSSSILVKRVIGLPGENIAEDRGTVIVNGRRLLERYISADHRDYGSFGPRLVPKGTYFLLGDNRRHSIDSRQFGVVPRSQIIGRVLFLYGSIWHFHTVKQ